MSLYAADCPSCSILLRIPLQIDVAKTCVLCPNCSTQFFAAAPAIDATGGHAAFDSPRTPSLTGLGQYSTYSNDSSANSSESMNKSRNSPGAARSIVFWVGVIFFGLFALPIVVAGIAILFQPTKVSERSPRIADSVTNDHFHPADPRPSEIRRAEEVNKLAKQSLKKLQEQSKSRSSGMPRNLPPPISNRSVNRIENNTNNRDSESSFPGASERPNLSVQPPQLDSPSSNREPRFLPRGGPGNRSMAFPDQDHGPGFPPGNAIAPPNFRPDFRTPESSLKNFVGPTSARIYVSNAATLDIKSIVGKLVNDLQVKGSAWTTSGDNLWIGLKYSGSLSEIVKRLDWGEIIEENSDERIIRIKVKKP